MVEAVQQFGPSIVSFQLSKGERRCYIVNCYLAPDNTSAIESVVAALKERPRGAKMLVEGDFKPVRAGGRPEGRRYCRGNGDGGNQGYVGALLPAPDLMVPGQEDMEYDPEGEGGEVPDGFHPGDRSPSIWECVHLRPQA